MQRGNTAKVYATLLQSLQMIHSKTTQSLCFDVRNRRHVFSTAAMSFDLCFILFSKDVLNTGLSERAKGAEREKVSV